jgi:hypothetical protein
MTTTIERSSITTTYGEDVAYVIVSTLPDGSWDVSERFQVEWDGMARELYCAGYGLPADEPTTLLAVPGGGVCEVYVCTSVVESLAS